MHFGSFAPRYNGGVSPGSSAATCAPPPAALDSYFRRPQPGDAESTRLSTIWLAGLRDERARAKILKRLDRARNGNLGDVGPVGEGVSEMRIFYGPGYRLYFVQKGAQLIVLLCGGSKATQDADIAEAKAIAREIG
jgi:putative addiction module killer protein